MNCKYISHQYSCIRPFAVVMYTRTAQGKNCLNLIRFSVIIIGQGKEMYPVSVCYNDRRISVVQAWTGESESIAYENFALFYNGRKHTVNIERLVEEAKDFVAQRTFFRGN